MAQPKDFLYFLTDDQGRSYRVQNGMVSKSSIPTPLPITPDGWQDKTIKYERSDDYFGMVRSFTTPLNFVRQAARIVRNQFYGSGTEDKLQLVINFLDKSFGGGWIHRLFYKGQLDLSQTKDSDSKVTVNIMEGGLGKFIRANENTEYELKLNVPEAVNVQHDGIFLAEQHNWVVLEFPKIGSGLVPVAFTVKEGTAYGVASFSAYPIDDTGFNPLTSQDYFFTVAQDIAGMRIEGSIKTNATVTINLPDTYVLRLVTNKGRNLIVHSFPFVQGDIISFDYDYTFDASEGESFFLYATVLPTTIFAYVETSVNLSYQSRFKTTFIKGLRPAYIAQKLLDAMTGGGYTFSSTYLTTAWENLVMTSGDGIRGFDNATLKISWSDFFKAYNVVANIQMSTKGAVCNIEEKATAFGNTVRATFETVANFEPAAATDYHFNVVKIGYPNTNTESLNGRYECNVTQTYTSPINSINRALDLVSPVKASMYEMEEMRINLEGKNTTDDQNDSSPYFLHVEKTATVGGIGEPAIFYKLLRNTYDSVEGLVSPETAYNLELHPELCLYRHGNYLRSIFYWQEAGFLNFSTSDKNGDVKIVKDGKTYVGNKSINIGSLSAPLFLPVLFTFESPVTRNIYSIMENTPNDSFAVLYEGNTFYGFPKSIGIQPATNASQETTLLCSPASNIKKLIR